MASGQREGGMDGKLAQTVGDKCGGMAHAGKLMANEGPMTKVLNSKLAPAGKINSMTKAGKR